MTTGARVRVGGPRLGLVGLLAFVLLVVVGSRWSSTPARALAEPGMVAATAVPGAARLERDDASARAAVTPTDVPALVGSPRLLHGAPAVIELATRELPHRVPPAPATGSLGPRGPPR